MSLIEEYLARVRLVLVSLPGAQPERYDEQIPSSTRGNVRIGLRFADRALLELTEAVVFVGQERAGSPTGTITRIHSATSSSVTTTLLTLRRGVTSP